MNQKPILDTAGAAHGRFARFRDIASGTPLFAIDIFVFAGLISGFGQEFRDFARTGDPQIALAIIQQFATIAFAILQIVLFFIRTLPLKKAMGLAPRAVALVSANMAFAFALLPRVHQSPIMLMISTSLTIVGLVASIYCAAVLGRSFSILPQARGFVSSGPYRIVRHPLYLAEQVTSFGICCQFLQPWSFLIAIASLGLQIVRMGYEEQVLSDVFPAYHDYAARTARLVPGIY